MSQIIDPSSGMERDVFARPCLYVDLHTHLRGTISPRAALRFATKNAVPLSTKLFSSESTYAWNGFAGFLQTYAAIGDTVKAASDLRDLASEWLIAAAREGLVYSELMMSPAHIERNGISLYDQLAAVQDGIVEAKAQTGVEARIVATCIRHHGPDEAMLLARKLLKLKHPLVVGFGLTGDEHKFAPKDFQEAYKIAAHAGLGLTAHTGEWRGPESVAETVRALKLNRIGHGLRAAENLGILQSLVQDGLGWEICLSSNLRLKYGNRPDDHPLRRLLTAGCRFGLGTDDPGFFDTSPQKEYALARSILGLADTQLHKISLDAVELAFCDAETKKRVRRAIVAGRKPI
jgi:adenosine deaminase